MLPHAASPRRALFGAGAVFLLATLTGFAHAAEKSPADTTKPVVFLKETVVTGSRYPRQFFESPQALSFVTRTQIREQMPTSIGDVLQQIPGVDNSKDSPWEQRPILRGLSGQRVLVLMDGSPMNSARGNGPHPSLVDPSQIDRVEVVRGPSSVSYGSDAIGGVINIITRQPLAASGANALHGGATVGGSSADRGYNGSLQLMPQFGKLTAFVSSGMSNAEDFRTPDHGRTPHSGFNAYNAIANLRYQLSDRTAIKGGWQLYRGHEIGLPGLDFTMPGFEQFFNFPYYRRDEANLAVEHQHAASSWLATTSAKVYWQGEGRDFYSHMAFDNSFFGPGTPPGTFVDNTDRTLKLNSGGVQLQASTRRFASGRLTFGADLARDVTDGTNLDVVSDEAFGPTTSTVSRSLPTGRFDNYGAFAQSDLYLDPRWTLSFGGRYTHYRDRSDFGVASPASNGGGGPPQPEVDFEPTKVDHDALAGSAGLVFSVNEDLHLTANVANGYRQPNAQDLFFNGPASVGLVIGNANLLPEKSVSSDIGLRWGPGDLAFSGNLFYSTYQDLIDAIQIAAGSSSGAPATYQYVNISEARIWGGEAEGEWRFRRRWLARASVTGAVGDITSRTAIRTLYGVDADQAPLPNVPPLKGSASVRWTSPGGRLWVEPGMRYSWRTNRLPLPTANVEQITAFKKEWMVGDVFAGYRLGDGQRIQVGVKNFTDRAYQLPIGSLEEPGISFIGSLSTSF